MLLALLGNSMQAQNKLYGFIHKKCVMLNNRLVDYTA